MSSFHSSTPGTSGTTGLVRDPSLLLPSSIAVYVSLVQSETLITLLPLTVQWMGGHALVHKNQ